MVPGIRGVIESLPGLAALRTVPHSVLMTATLSSRKTCTIGIVRDVLNILIDLSSISLTAAPHVTVIRLLHLTDEDVESGAVASGVPLARGLTAISKSPAAALMTASSGILRRDPIVRALTLPAAFVRGL